MKSKASTTPPAAVRALLRHFRAQPGYQPIPIKQDMTADDVDVQVVSPMPELLSHWFSADDADLLASHINREIAALS